MKYPRPEYGDPSVPMIESEISYSPIKLKTPKFDTPITARENFRRSAARDNPLWVPNGLTDMQSLGANDIINHHVRGMQVHTDFLRRATENYDFKDWFNTDWEMVVSAGGAMLKPGTKLLEDICDWEKEIVFPNLDEWGLEERAAEYMKNYNPDKIMHYDIGRGLTERLVSLTGGYTDGMMALALEPEACLDFFERYADFVIELFDRINSLYPLDLLTYHDDWGTERDTFFSEKMFVELVQKPTARIIDHVHSKNVVFQMHSCGNVTRFIPYVAEMGAEFLQIQRRAVDMPKLKRELGDKIGFMASLEGVEFGVPMSDAEMVEAIRRTVDIYAPGGGVFMALGFGDPKQQWLALSELYAYSREFYDKEQGRD
ncbi:MAG: hypothetical protein LBN43_03345 [Oscillospiraceae bacterium]|jgi:hypothetical protein|nr:hypothetical protein [Oscillospiraceae bacterium]